MGTVSHLSESTGLLKSVQRRVTLQAKQSGDWSGKFVGAANLAHLRKNIFIKLYCNVL